MASIMFYRKDTGEIFNTQSGHPHDKDPLTKARQKEILLKLFPHEYYDIGIVVSEGDDAKFFPDVIEDCEIDGRNTKRIINSKVKDINRRKNG